VNPYDGSVYHSSADGTLTALDSKTGNVKFVWNAGNDSGHPISPTTPIVGRDAIYFGTSPWAGIGSVVSLSFDGQVVWTWSPPPGDADPFARFDAPPIMDSKGTLYIGGGNGFVYAISAQGKLLWSYDGVYEISSSAALSNDESILGNVCLGFFGYLCIHSTKVIGNLAGGVVFALST
jgi:outer membrane protein assembly factor BamB